MNRLWALLLLYPVTLLAQTSGYPAPSVPAGAVQADPLSSASIVFQAPTSGVDANLPVPAAGKTTMQYMVNGPQGSGLYVIDGLGVASKVATATGTVAKATALAATPTGCPAGQSSNTFDASGNALNCTVSSGGAVAATSIPTAGLTTDLHFQDGSGTTARDSSPAGNSGTLGTGGAAPTWAAQGLAFAPGNNVSLPAALNNSQTFLFAVYINPIFADSNGAAVSPTITYPGLLTSSMTGGAGINLLHNYSFGGNLAGPGLFSPTIYNGVVVTGIQNVIAGFHVITYVLGTGAGNLDHIYIDGVETGVYSNHGSTAGAQTSGNLFLGSSGVGVWGGMGMNGTLYRFATYSGQLTAAQVASASASMTTEIAGRGVAVTPKPLSVARAQLFPIGDSITYGFNLTTPATQAWPANLALVNAPTYQIASAALIGYGVQAMEGSEANRYAPSCLTTAGPSAAIVFAGTNDFANQNLTPTQVMAYLASEIGILKTAGCRVFAGTMISRTGNAYGGVVYDVDKDGYDALILSQAKAAGAEGVVDFAANPLLGADGAYANATYFGTDAIHPTAAGQLLLATAASNSLNYYNGYKASSPRTYTATATMASGDGFVITAPAAATTLTMPDCTGPSGEIYTISNPQATFPVSVIGGTNQLIDGQTTAILIAANSTVTLRDVPKPKAVSGCGWASSSTTITAAQVNGPIRVANNSILHYADELPINDGAVHTIGNAPSTSRFSGLTTIAQVAALRLSDGSTPFASFLNQTTPFAYTNSLLTVGVTNFGSGGTPGTYAWTVTAGCSTAPTGRVMVGRDGRIKHFYIDTHGSCQGAPTFSLTAATGLTGFVLSPTVLTDATVPNWDLSWLAGEAALYTTHQLYYPAGTYVWGSQYALPLILPEAAEGAGVPVSNALAISGDGENRSILMPGKDFGLDATLVSAGDPAGNHKDSTTGVGNEFGRYGRQGMYSGFIRDLGMSSVYATSNKSEYAAPGQTPILMDGIHWGARLRMQNVKGPDGFFRDVSLVGDHTVFVGWHLEGGAWGYFWDAMSDYLYGDLQFVGMAASGQSIASLGVDKDSSISGHFSAETYLSAPYAMLAEAPADPQHCNPAMNQAIFDRLMTEYIGNAAFAEETDFNPLTNTYTTPSTNCRSWKGKINYTYPSWDNGHFWGGGRGRLAYADVGGWHVGIDDFGDGGNIVPFQGPSGPAPVAVFRQANGLSGSSMQADDVLSVLGGATPSVPLSNGDGSGMALRSKGGSVGTSGAWSGITSVLQGDGNNSVVTAGDLLILPYGAGFPIGEPNRSGLTGVALQRGPVNTTIAVATAGNIAINTGTTPAVGYGVLKAGSGIGATLTMVAGTAGTPGTYPWTGSGGGCTTAASGTYTIPAGGTGLTSYAITVYGVACTSRPGITLDTSVSLLQNGSLTPFFPASLGAVASGWQDGHVIGPVMGTATGQAVVSLGPSR